MKWIIPIVVMLLLFTACAKQEEDVTYVNISDLLAEQDNNKVTGDVVTDVTPTEIDSDKDIVDKQDSKVEIEADVETKTDSSTESTEQITKEEKEKVTLKPPAEKPKATNSLFTVTVTEGEKVSLKPKASDPDNDKLQYSYSDPLNVNGQWETKEGDAGTYTATITVSDGKSATSQDVTIIVEALNKAPVIKIDSPITIDEGKTLRLEPEVTDEDGDKVTVNYDGWIDKSVYEVSFKDAGTHEITITASDGKKSTVKTVSVIVNNVNRAPKIDSINDITVTEGEKIQLNVKTTDLDDDTVKVTYPDPFDNTGFWQTEVGDDGTYKMVVRASDSELEDTESFVVTVLVANNLPKIVIADEMTVDEGDTVRLRPKVTDEDGDDVTITYSGWMSTSSKETGYDDAGEYNVQITADDGVGTQTKTVKIIVEDVNRPPVIEDIVFE